MIASGLLKIMLTVWINGHPVTHLLPKEYPRIDNAKACIAVMNSIVEHAKKGVHVKAECIAANTRGI